MPHDHGRRADPGVGVVGRGEFVCVERCKKMGSVWVVHLWRVWRGARESTTGCTGCVVRCFVWTGGRFAGRSAGMRGAFSPFRR